jgi:hypothetical protein
MLIVQREVAGDAAAAAAAAVAAAASSSLSIPSETLEKEATVEERVAPAGGDDGSDAECTNTMEHVRMHAVVSVAGAEDGTSCSGGRGGGGDSSGGGGGGDGVLAQYVTKGDNRGDGANGVAPKAKEGGEMAGVWGEAIARCPAFRCAPLRKYVRWLPPYEHLNGRGAEARPHGVTDVRALTSA